VDGASRIVRTGFIADRNRRVALRAIALIFLLVATPGLARAATITVTTLADPIGPPGTCSMRQAITNAVGQNQSGSADCIAGTGTDTIVFEDGLTGTISIGGAGTLPAIVGGETLTITGPATMPGITIDGGQAVRLMIVNLGATLNLQFLTLANGSVTGNPGTFGSGGAIDSRGNLTVTNCAFSSNQAIGGSDVGGGFGGAISSDGTTATLTVTDSTFSDNQATGGAGSVAGSGRGGAIFNNQSKLTVTDSTFSGNQAAGGAGSASGAQGIGGAIFTSRAVVNVTNTTFSANQAIGSVGTGGESEGFGSVLSNDVGSGGAVKIFESTLSANQAIGSAQGGGAIVNAGVSVILRGTILAGSLGGNCLGVGVGDNGYNLSDDNTCGFFATSRNNVGDIDLAGGLAQNGGPTETIALLFGSAAIAQVPPAACVGANGKRLLIDQRGYGRPAPGQSACCIGAYEFDAVPTPTPTPTATPTATMATPTATPTAVPVTLKIKPREIKFAKEAVGTPSKPKSVKVSNPKGNRKHPGLPVLIEMISDPAVFTETNDCPPILAPGASCTIAVTFTPGMTGQQTGTLTITDNANGSTQTVSLTGEGK
jgi:hypothetical protein